MYEEYMGKIVTDRGVGETRTNWYYLIKVERRLAPGAHWIVYSSRSDSVYKTWILNTRLERAKKPTRPMKQKIVKRIFKE